MKIAPALPGVATGAAITCTVAGNPVTLLLLTAMVIVVAAVLVGLGHLYLRVGPTRQAQLLKLLRTWQRR